MKYKRIGLGLLGLTGIFYNKKQFNEGNDYERINNKNNTNKNNTNKNKIEVRYYFGHFCKNCYDQLEYLNIWKQDKNNIELVYTPAIWSPNTKQFAKFFYAIRILNNFEKLHSALFSEIHDNKKIINNENLFIDFLKTNNITRKDIIKIKKYLISPELNKNLKEIEESRKKHKISRIPAFVINNKYMVSNKGGNKTFNIINFLVKKELK